VQDRFGLLSNIGHTVHMAACVIGLVGFGGLSYTVGWGAITMFLLQYWSESARREINRIIARHLVNLGFMAQWNCW
jgi:hypothetical protein